MNACSIRDIGRFGKTVLFLFSSPITQFMRHIFAEPLFVFVYIIIDGLVADMDALFGKDTAYLTGRPVLLYNHLFNTPPQKVILAVIR